MHIVSSCRIRNLIAIPNIKRKLLSTLEVRVQKSCTVHFVSLSFVSSMRWHISWVLRIVFHPSLENSQQGRQPSYSDSWQQTRSLLLPLWPFLWDAWHEYGLNENERPLRWICPTRYSLHFSVTSRYLSKATIMMKIPEYDKCTHAWVPPRIWKTLFETLSWLSHALLLEIRVN